MKVAETGGAWRCDSNATTLAPTLVLAVAELPSFSVQSRYVLLTTTTTTTT